MLISDVWLTSVKYPYSGAQYSVHIQCVLRAMGLIMVYSRTVHLSNIVRARLCMDSFLHGFILARICCVAG